MTPSPYHSTCKTAYGILETRGLAEVGESARQMYSQRFEHCLYSAVLVLLDKLAVVGRYG